MGKVRIWIGWKTWKSDKKKTEYKTREIIKNKKIIERSLILLPLPL